MSAEHRINEADQQLRWPAFAIAALLAGAILFGGGGAEGALNNGIILASSALLLCALIAAHAAGLRPLPASATVPVLIVAGFLILGASQVVPLPVAAWQAQPGRDVAAGVLQLVQGADGSRPLSLDPEATRRAMAAMLLPAAMMLAIVGSSRREIQLFLYTILGCALVSGVIGALQLALGYPAWLTYYEGGNAGAASGVFANVNHHAALLLAGIVCAGIAVRLNSSAAAHSGRAPRRRFDPIWLLVPIFIVVVLATGSRAALLLLGLAVPVSAIIGTGKTSAKLLLVALLGVGVVVLVLSELAPAGNQIALGQSLAVGQDKRYAILPDVWFTLKQYWPTGSGFGTFAQVFGLNEDLDLAGFEYVNHAHNDVLELLTEGGVAGLVWVAVAVLAVVARVVLVQIKDGSARTTRAALVWGGFFILALLGLHSLADYPLRTASVAAVAGIAFGLVFVPERPEPRRKFQPGRAAAGFVVAGVAGLLLGGQVLRMYAAQAAVRGGSGAAAMRADPQNGAGLALASEEELNAHHLPQAKSLAAEAIRHSPLSARAVRVLALARDIENRGGMQAWRVASSMGWRDTATQFWAMQQALLNQEFPTAAIRADALLRTSPDPGMERTGAIRALANSAPFRAELIRRLMLEPRWSSNFFTVSSKASDQQLQGVFLTLMDLVRAGERISVQEARSAIQALIDRRQYGSAAALDRIVARRNSTDPVHNLDFTEDTDHYVLDVTPFDWNIVDRGGTIVSVEQSGSQRVLELGTDGRRQYQPARKYVALAPGAYRISYVMRGEANSPEMLGLAAYCANSSKPLATSPADPLEGKGFVQREFQFTVPSACPLVLLVFEARRGDGPAEAQFADLSLAPA